MGLWIPRRYHRPTNYLPSVDIRVTPSGPQGQNLVAWWPVSSHAYTDGLVDVVTGTVAAWQGSALPTIQPLNDVGDTTRHGDGVANSYFSQSDFYGLDSTVTSYSAFAWVVITPGTSASGAWFKIGGTSDGFALGYGGSDDTFATIGTKVIFLKEGVSWHATTATISNGLQHVGFTTDGSTLRVYFNAAEVASISESHNAITTGISLGGYNQGTSRIHTGNLVDMRLYSVALTTTQIAQLYEEDSRWDLYRGVTPPGARWT